MSFLSGSLKGISIASLLLVGVSLQATNTLDPKLSTSLTTVPTQNPTAPLAAAPSATPVNGSLDGIPMASPHAAFVRQPSSPDAWGGARTGKEATLSDRVVNYDISASLDPVHHTVDGQEKLTWRNRSNREVRSIYLHM